MAKHKRDLLLWLKKYPSGLQVFFYSLLDKETNERLPWKSTGIALSGKTKSDYRESEDKARAYVKALLEKPKEPELPKEHEKLFKEFASTFFDEDQEFVQLREMKKGKYSLNYLYDCRVAVRSYVLPYFGDLVTGNIKTREIENILLKMKNEKVPLTMINKTLVVLKTILGDLERREILNKNPARLVKPLRVISKQKGIFTDFEIIELFNPDRMIEVWKNKKFYILNRLLSSTGLRVGEALALQDSDIKYVHKAPYLFIHQNIGIRFQGYLNSKTKTGKNRDVNIHPKMEAMLMLLISENYDGHFIFSETQGLLPIAYHTVLTNFKKAKQAIGIENTRNVTLHSWRHHWTTYLKKENVSLREVMATIGHSTEEMSNHYTQALSIENMTGIMRAQEKIFENDK